MASLKFEAFPTDAIALYDLASKLGNDKPLKRILFLARDLGCKTIVYQRRLVHPGFKSEWENYYKYIQPPPPSTVDRLNFFSKTLAVSSDLKRTDSSDFLGYVTLRPIPIQRVCDAVLRVPNGGLNNDFILSKGIFSTYVGKHRYEVEGTYFVQQDSNAGVCAHACLIMISQIVPHIFPGGSFQAWTVSQINKFAGEMPTPPFEPGLCISHVSRIFQEMGFSGDTLYTFPQDQSQFFQPDQLIYMYAESRIPVFVGLPLTARGAGHSVVVIGHSLERHAWWPEAWPSYYTTLPSSGSWLSSASWVNEWVICDDNFGPYLAMPKHICDVAWIAVPLPRNILIKGDIATITAFWIVRDWILRRAIEEASKRQFSRWSAPFLRHLSEGKIVLRIFLTTPKEFQESIRRDNIIKKEIADYYLNLRLPDNFWLGELSIPELFGEGLRLGEVLINPFYPRNFMRSGYEPLVFAHAPGAVLIYSSREKKFKPYLVPNDCPSKVMSRGPFSHS